MIQHYGNKALPRKFVKVKFNQDMHGYPAGDHKIEVDPSGVPVTNETQKKGLELRNRFRDSALPPYDNLTKKDSAVEMVAAVKPKIKEVAK